MRTGRRIGRGPRHRPRRRIAIGGLLARLDLVSLAAAFQTEGDVERLEHVEAARRVQPDDILVVDQRPVAEVARRRAAIGVVGRIERAEADLVPAIAERQVDIEPTEIAAQTRGRVRVLHLGIDDRQEAVGIPRQSGRGTGQPREGGAARVAVLITAERVQAPVVGQRRARVDEAGILLDFRVAVTTGDAVGRHAPVEVRTVGRAALQIFAGNGQETVLAEPDPLPQRGGNRVLAGHRAPAVRGVHVGVVESVIDLRTAARPRFAQAQVDDAGDRVRAILRGGAVAQHLDSVERHGRDGVEVDRRRSPTHGAVGVEQGRGMAANAVDQHQGLVRRQAAQRRRADRVGAVIGGRPREIDRRGDRRQRGGQLGRALSLQAGAAQHIDRRGAVQPGAPLGTRTGDDDDVALLFRCRGIGDGCGLRFLRRRRRLCGKGERGTGGEQRCAEKQHYQPLVFLVWWDGP